MQKGRWIEVVKHTQLPQVVQALGLTSRRLSSFGPCPGCGEDCRGRDDRRGAAGLTGDRRGWKCHRCNIKGDALDLVAWVRTGGPSGQMTKEQWVDVREWCTSQGWVQATDASPAPPVSSVAKLLGQDRRRGSQGGDDSGGTPGSTTTAVQSAGANHGDGGPFAWREGLAEDCAAQLWHPSPYADAVLAYLRDGRKFTDETIRDWDLGCTVIKGEPWLTIPLRDESERVVNVRFRSIPPAKKTYRVCPGRPLPLFGSHNLGNDLGGNVVVCEGELDVIAMWQYGLNVSVVSGTAGAGAWKDPWLDQLEPYGGFILCYDNDEAGEAGAKGFADKMGLDRCSRAVLPKKDAGECLQHGVSAESIFRVLDRAQPMFGVQFRDVSSYAAGIERLIDNPTELRGRPTGSDKLDRCLGGLRPGVMIVSGDTGHGKAQPLDEPVLTPIGWRPIGELEVGDEVITVTGAPTRVTRVFPQGVRDVVRVTFNDGATVRCDGDHLWNVATDSDLHRGRPWRTKTAYELAGDLRQGRRLKWRVPVVAPVIHHLDVTLPVDPYVLGVLIGDGSLTQTGVQFTNGDQHITDRVRQRLPYGHVLRVTPDRNTNRCRIVAPDIAGNFVGQGLAGLGLRGCKSVHKFIPTDYQRADLVDRLLLLQGLMDTDGTVEQGRPKYGTSSPDLARDVVALVRSLGGVARLTSKIPKYTYNGEKRVGATHYTVSITMPRVLATQIFSLPRKRDLLGEQRLDPQRKITSIEPNGQAECVCIAVEHESSLYVTRDYVVTHNTTWATWLLWQQARMGVPVMLTSFEQRPIGTVQKLLRMQLGGDFTAVTAEDRAAALDKLGAMPLHILDHYGQMPAEDLMQATRYAVRRLGVKVVLIDHLHFLLDPNAPDKVSAIETVVRALAITGYSLGVLLMVVCHPKGLPQGAQRVTINDLKGASAIKQDASEVVIVERDPPKPKGKNPRNWPAAWVHFDKVRSEFGIPGSKAQLAFGPMSCRYGDRWEDTPEGRAGALIVTPG